MAKRKGSASAAPKPKKPKKKAAPSKPEGDAIALYIPQTPPRPKLVDKSDGFRATSRSEIGLPKGQTPKEFKTPTKGTSYRRSFSLEAKKSQVMFFTSVDDSAKKPARKSGKHTKSEEKVKKNLPANTKSTKTVHTRITKKKLEEWKGKSDDRHPSQQSVMGNVRPNNYADVINGGLTVPSGVRCNWTHLAGHFTGGPKGGPQQRENLGLASEVTNQREIGDIYESVARQVVTGGTDIALKAAAKLVPDKAGGYTDVMKNITYRMTNIQNGKSVCSFFQSPLKNIPPSRKLRRLVRDIIRRNLGLVRK